MIAIFDTILILAGGDGSRYWPLTQKNTATYTGKPLIFHQIERLRPFAHHIVVVTNPEIHEAVSAIPDITVVVQDDVSQGQAGAVLSARSYITGEVLIVNANDIFDTSVLRQMREVIQANATGFAFLAKKVTDYFPGGYVSFDGDRITGIIEKPPADHVPSDTVKLVVDYVAHYRDLVAELEQTHHDSDDRYERGLSALIERGVKTDVVYYDSFWHTVKYSWHVLDMLHFFLHEMKDQFIDPSAQVSPHAIITGPVYIGRNVKIGDFAKIVGPTYIDDEAIIGDFAMVRDSQIGRGALVGGYSEVTRSYLARGVMLHRNYVGDSVLDQDVLMGAQAVTANFRFDKKTVQSFVSGKKINTGLAKMGAIIGRGAKIGVNSTVLPGIKIGRNTFVGPHTAVTQDIEDNIFLVNGEQKENKMK